jgi:uncharacterized protein (UPF0261 family)
MLNREGQVLYDKASNDAFAAAMEQVLSPDVELIKVDSHINDRAFADATVGTFLRLREARRASNDRGS